MDYKCKLKINFGLDCSLIVRRNTVDYRTGSCDYGGSQVQHIPPVGPVSLEDPGEHKHHHYHNHISALPASI